MRTWLDKLIKGKRTPLVLAFLIPFFIMLGVCIYREVFPFGENCILHVDMYHQYAPFFMEFLDKLKNGGSLMYSWDLGLGSDFVGAYAYYLASPMNWLLILCPRQFLIEFMTILVLVKTGLCGFTFAYYLRKHFQTENLSVVFPAVFYALSGFVCAYYWDIMWLDCIFLAPLIILGLEELVKRGRWKLYCVTLAVSVWSNYYISIMICIFLVLYFIILFFEEGQKGKRLKIFVSFAGYSVLSAGISAVILFPEIKLLGYSGSGNLSFPEQVQWYFGAIAELARHCINIGVTTTEGDLPNLYCGVAVLFLIVLYVLNKKIAWKKKVPRLLLLAFFLVSFSCNILDFIWHGFHFPDGLPARQSFLYIFLLLSVCYEVLLKREGNNIRDLVISGAAAGGMLIVFAVFTDDGQIPSWSVVVTALLCFCYLFLFVVERSKDLSMKKTAWFLTFLVVVAEAAMNLNSTGIDVTSRTVYTKDLEDYRTLTESAAETDDGFYRTEKFERMMKNESCLSGHASASVFSSLININVADAYKSVGMEGGKNFYCYNGATPVMSAMLGVKYMLTDSGDEESPLRTLVAQSGDSYLYENTYSLPLGFMVSSSMEEEWDRENLADTQAVNRLGEILGAGEDTLIQMEAAEITPDDTVIHVEEDCYVYASYFDKSLSTITEEVNGRSRTFTKCSHLYLLDLGWCEAGTDIHLSSPQTDSLVVFPFKLNLNSVETAFNTLNSQTMTLDSKSDTKIAGHIEVEEAGNLVLTIPKEEGWKVMVDGEEVETDSFMGAFFAIPLTEGSHTIKLTYLTPGLLPGAAVSIICFLILCGLWLRGMLPFLHKIKRKS